jgi:hypothetical protein
VFNLVDYDKLVDAYLVTNVRSCQIRIESINTVLNIFFDRFFLFCFSFDEFFGEIVWEEGINIEMKFVFL